MQKIKPEFVAIIVGLGVTLILSLFLVFAQNMSLPLLRSTGLGLLGFGKEIIQINPNNGNIYTGPESFFNNVYSYSDNAFEVFGVIVSGLYWVFCIACIGVMCFVLLSMLVKPKQMKLALKLTFAVVFLGIGLVAIAVLCIIVPTFLYNFQFLYITQYFFLLIPIVATLVATIMAYSKLNSSNRQNAAPATAGGYPGNAAPATAGGYPGNATPPAQTVGLTGSAPASISAQAPKPAMQTSTWSSQVNGGSQYYSLKAENLYAASEILKGLGAVPPQTYYLVDTDDGTLGRDINGFFTEAPIKTNGLKVQNPNSSVEPVAPLSLMIYGEMLSNQSSVAHLKLSGQYAKLVLMMKCGHCGYESPVETDAGALERQCYNCGSTNKTNRAAININTAYGIVEI